MISRVAENCFWLARYVERTETHARVLDVSISVHLDGSLAEADQWRPLVVVSGEEERFLRLHGEPSIHDAEAVLEYLTWSQENPTSIYSSVRLARENVRTIRETASLEMWETINDVWLWLNRRAAQRLYMEDRHGFFLRVRDQCLLFEGMRYGTMLHEEAFEFMRLGTVLERASQTARVLDMKYHSLGPERAVERPIETAQWLAALRCCSGVEPFSKRSAGEPSGPAVAAFLLFDRSFPRSVRHNLEQAVAIVATLRPPEGGIIGDRTAKLLEAMVKRIRTLTIEVVLAQGIHEILTWVVDASAEICDAVHTDFFDPPAEAPAAAAS